ncbi:hypothetical protein Tco_0836712, partial [Tanacetum coccineum]
PGKDYILLPLWTADPPFSQNSKSSLDAGFKPSGDDEKKVTEEPEKEGGDPSKEGERGDQEKDVDVNSTNSVYTVSSPVNIVSSPVNAVDLPDDPNMPPLEDIVYSNNDEDVGAEADMNNLDAFMPVSPIPTTRVHKDHPVKQIIGDLNSAPQTRRMTKNLEEYGKSFYNSSYKKFGFTEVKTASTPMETQKPLLKDEDGEEVDIPSQSKVSHLHAVKRIFRYSKGQPKMGLWYPKDSLFDLVAYTDSDYARASLDKKSTTGGCQFLGCRLISWQCKKQTVVANSTTEAEYVAALSCCGQKIIITESTVRRDLQLEDAEGVDCLPNATIFEQLTLMGPKTTAWNKFSSTMASAIICLATNQKFNFSKLNFESMMKNLDNVYGKFLMYPSKQTSVIIIKTRSKAASNEAGSQGTTSGGGPRCQDTMRDTIVQTRFENELMEFCTKLQQRVLDLENTKTAQASEITRVVKSEFLLLKAIWEIRGMHPNKGRTIDDNEKDAEIYTRQDMAEKEINMAEKEVIATESQYYYCETLIEIRSAKPKVKGVVIREQSESTTRTRPQ